VSPSELGVQEPDLAKKLEIVVDRPLQSEAEARMLATNQLRQIGEVLVEAKGKTVGLPDLRAGVKIEIKGLGKRFTGTYLVTGTTHSIGDSGYTTDFNARMEKL
jgi:Bacteriophage probable baseplate hub protein